jgi:hypothetical protein
MKNSTHPIIMLNMLIALRTIVSAIMAYYKIILARLLIESTLRLRKEVKA